MTGFSSLRNTSGPSSAVEVAATRVSGATIEWCTGQPAVAAYALEPLPDGAVVGSLNAVNVVERDVVCRAVGRVLAHLGRPHRIALVVPDPVAKVSLVKFERVATRADDLDELVRWQVRKATPFAIDRAQLSYVTGQRTPDGQEFIVSMVRGDVIEEYERLATVEGAHAGLVDLATVSVVNAVLASSAPSGDWLLVNIAPEYATLAILRGPHVIFFRNRATDTDGTLADLVHQTAMYYEDRLSGVGFTRVLIAGGFEGGTGDARRAVEVDLVRRSLEDRLATTVDTVDPRAAVTLADHLTSEPAFLDTLAPLVGILLRGREQAG